MFFDDEDEYCPECDELLDEDGICPYCEDLLDEEDEEFLDEDEEDDLFLNELDNELSDYFSIRPSALICD